MTTLNDLDKYIRSQRTPCIPKSGRGAGTHRTKGSAEAKSLSLSRALSMLSRPSLSNRHPSLALTRPLDYEIPGVIGPERQPSSMACWATTYTMLVGWRDQRSSSIEAALGRVGQKWVDLFRANTGAAAEQEAELYAATGLVAEPLASYTLDAWDGMLRQYGPLAVIVDVDPGAARAMHMIIVAGIHGDGSADGTTLTIVDPARGDKRPVKFSDFLAQYHQGAARRTASGRHNQVVHWPKDVKFAGARGFGVRALTSAGDFQAGSKVPAAPTGTAQPWSRYFQFRKGSTFEIDGPLSYNGTGQVIERTADFIKFTMKMPAVSIFGNDIPAADMVVEATYTKEGKGNLVAATINGVAMQDPDAEIVSSGSKRTIRPKFTGFSGPLPEWISITPDGSDEIDLDMRIDGRDVDFDLNRTSGSSGLALGVTPWSVSFPFASGSAFAVDGPGTFDGRGRVLERTTTRLKIEINMPEALLVAPKLDLVLEAEYAKEGPGNRVNLTVNGTQHSDTNATIASDPRQNRRTIVLSIAIPGTKLQQIAFGPEANGTIDFDVTIDGKEHDFDLTKVAGAVAQSWIRALAAGSTAASAVKEVAAFAARTGPTRWLVSRAAVAARLDQLVKDADLVDQGALNLCGPAIFFHVYVRRDPVAFARYAADLFEKGSASIGSLTVKPKDDLVRNDYAKIVPRMSPVTPVAEWMCLSALRDSENAVATFEGDPSENVAGMTTPGELADWMKASGIYTRVSDEGNWVASKGLTHATALSPAPNRDVLMLINAHIIAGAAPHRKKFLDAFPNHFIQLLSRVLLTKTGTVEFDYWTWGMPGVQHAAVPMRDFIDNYYGTVTGEV